MNKFDIIKATSKNLPQKEKKVQTGKKILHRVNYL